MLGAERAMAGETDELVGAAQGGDDAAYEALFARVARRLLLYVRVRLGPRLAGSVDPMDVVQETYLEAHRAFPAFEQRTPGAFTRWLLRIADHRLHDLSDRLGATKRRAFQEAARGSAVLERLRAEQSGPVSESERREEHQALIEGLSALDEREREVLLLRFFHGLTLEECAAQLAVSEPTVRRLLARGQIALGGLLGGLDG